jgi:hypothetical protein
MERTETPAQRRKPPVTEIPVPVAAAPAPYSATPKRARSSDRRRETRSGETAQCGLRCGRLCRCQASAESVASRIDGSQSECGAKFGRRDGGDLDRASAACPDATAENIGQHERDRVGVLNCGAGLSKRETLARRRPAGALGRVWTLGCTETVPPHHRVYTDPRAHQRIGNAGAV